MDNITYALRQSIGIYYKDRAWAEQLFNEVAYHYPNEMVERTVKNQFEMRITLKDTTTIDFVQASENYCIGRRFSKVILQPGINEDIVRTIILPTFTHSTLRIMIFTDDKKLEYWRG